MAAVNLRKESPTPSRGSSTPNRSAVGAKAAATRSPAGPTAMAKATTPRDTVDIIVWSIVLALALAGWAFAIWLCAILLKDGVLFPW